MKKLALLIASISLMTISCCNQDKQNTSDQNTEMTEEHPKGPHCDKRPCHNMSPEEQAECKLMKENWENWDNLSDEAKKECITKIKSHMDAKEAEMKAQKEMMEAKKLEMDAKWADFDNLSLDEQKEVIDFRMHGMQCMRDKGCCKRPHEGKPECKQQCPKQK
ncbi:MAG: hypothetical protein J5701_00605 [Bacteroidales bacterium]|nr:hypothetical protein [Bacteroidales bacterium]